MKVLTSSGSVLTTLVLVVTIIGTLFTARLAAWAACTYGCRFVSQYKGVGEDGNPYWPPIYYWDSSHYIVLNDDGEQNSKVAAGSTTAKYKDATGTKICQSTSQLPGAYHATPKEGTKWSEDEPVHTECKDQSSK